MEAARTMLIFAKAPMFLWAEVVATACYTLTDLSFIHYTGRPTMNCLRLKAKADIGIFVDYALTKKAYRIYNKRTHKIQEIVHVTFDELTEGMTSVQPSTGLRPNSIAHGHNAPSVPTTEKQLSELFQSFFDEDEEFPMDVHLHLVNVAPPYAPEIAPDSPSTTTVTEDALAATTITSPSQTSPPHTGVDGSENTITTFGSKSFKILSLMNLIQKHHLPALLM
ncbi:hypothetical protein Tco_1566916 [Tanacetum coccineum]